MKIRNFFVAAFILLAAASCVKENPSQNVESSVKYVPMEFSANIETKTVLTDGGKVNWLAGDKITIFDCSATAEQHNNLFTVSDDLSSFTGTVPEDAPDMFYALYPYRSGSSIDLVEGKISTTLSPVQEAVTGTFADDLAIMAAQAVNGRLDFVNVCSHVKFTLAEDMTDVKSITLMGNKAEVLAGTFTIALAGADIMLVPVANKAETYVTLRKSDGTALSAGDYFFTVLPVSFTEGFTVILSKMDGTQVAKKTSAEYSQISTRNKILTMKPLASTDYSAHENYFVKYNDGFDLTFSGITFNKTTNPGGVLVSDNRDKSVNLAASDTGVYFVTPSCTKANFNQAAAYKSLIVVGADASVRSNVDFYRQVRPYDGGELMLLANLRCTVGDKNAFAQNLKTEGNAFKTFGNIVLSNCHFKKVGKNFFEFNTTNVFTKLNLIVEDCEFGISGETVFMLNVPKANAASAQTISFKNNIFYAESDAAATKFRLIYGEALKVDSFNLESTTFDKVIPQGNMIIVGDIATSFGMSKNLFYECNRTATTVKIVAFKINNSAKNASGITTNNVYFNSTSNALVGAGIGSSAYSNMTINSFKALSGNPMPSTWNPAEEVYGNYSFDEGVSNTIGAKRKSPASSGTDSASYRNAPVELGSF